MIGKKTFISNIIGAFHFQTFLYTLLKHSKLRLLPILAYHRIINIKEVSSSYEEINVSASPQQFDCHLRFIRKHFNTISFYQLKNFLLYQKPIPKNPLIITFDDGYKDNYLNALPLLIKYGMKATFFLAVKYINGNHIFDFEQLTYAIKHSNKKALDLKIHGLPILSLSDKVARNKARKICINRMRQFSPTKNKIFLNDIFDKLEVTIPPKIGHEVIMSWEHVLKLASAGMEIGSHSMTHPILSNLTTQELYYEVLESKRELEKILRQKVTAFSYPASGKEEYFGMREKMIVKNAGYAFGVSFLHGLNRINSIDNYSLKRIHIPRYLSQNQFEMGIIFPKFIR